MAVKYEQMVKRHHSYMTPERCGVRCHIHNTTGEYPLHRHDYIEIEYIVKGKMEHEINGEKSILQQGNCYCLLPHDLHRFRIIEPIVIHNICIDYLRAPLPIRNLLSGQVSPLTGTVNGEVLKQLMDWFERLSALIDSDEPYADEKINAYSILIISCIFEYCTAEEQKPVRNYQNISRAMEYIAEHYSENIRLHDVADALYLSVGHLSKLFAKINGVSFSDYLSNYRIEKAQQALHETNQSITEIAFSCGFNSFPTFSRSFKKMCGCTPSQYRNHRNEGKI